jgi:hypothetical protein
MITHAPLIAKKAFDSLSHTWPIEVLELRTMQRTITTILEENMEMFNNILNMNIQSKIIKRSPTPITKGNISKQFK